MEFSLNVKVLLCQPHSQCGCHTPGLALAAAGRPISLGFSHKAADVLQLKIMGLTHFFLEFAFRLFDDVKVPV